MAFYLTGIVLMVCCNWLLSYYDKLRVYLNICKIYVLLGIIAFLCSLSSNSLFGYVIVIIVGGALTGPVAIIENMLLRDLVILDTVSFELSAFIMNFIPDYSMTPCFMFSQLRTQLNREAMYQVALTLPVGITSNLIMTIPQMLIAGFTKWKTIDRTDDDSQLISDCYTWTESTFCVSQSFLLTKIVSA